MLQCSLRFFDVTRGMKMRTIRIRSPELDNAGHRWLAWPTAWISGELYCAACGTVVTAIGGEHFVAPRMQTSHANCVFSCFGAAICEEHHIEIARCEFGNEPCCFATRIIGVHWCNSAEFVCLFFDCSNQFWMLVADVEIDELTRKIKVFFSVFIPEPCSLSTCNHDGVNESLRRPRMKDM